MATKLLKCSYNTLWINLYIFGLNPYITDLRTFIQETTANANLD